MTQPTAAFLVQQADRATYPAPIRRQQRHDPASHWPKAAALAVEWARLGLSEEEVLAEVQQRYDEYDTKMAAFVTSFTAEQAKPVARNSAAAADRAANTARLLAAMTGAKP